MSLRVVLFAEGAGELLGASRFGPAAVGETLNDDELGAAHILVRRALDRCRRIPPQAVHFQSPPRKRRGTAARGSDLRDRETLRQLLTWLDPALRPDLAIVLVDEDGDARRRDRLLGWVADLAAPKVVAVAVREFEAWMMADHAALRHVLAPAVPDPGQVEALPPGQAKAILDELRGAHRPDLAPRDLKRTLAGQCDLQALAARCPSFDLLLRDLAST